jgi:hypothetical protein
MPTLTNMSKVEVVVVSIRAPWNFDRQRHLFFSGSNDAFCMHARLASTTNNTLLWRSPQRQSLAVGAE